MKLKNKKTGEIEDLIEIVRIDDVSNEFYLRLSDNKGRTFKVGFNSLAELNEDWEDWEDYEDDGLSKIIEWIDKGLEDEILPISVNDFVEKLKAWKRLKDKGISFEVTVIDRKWYLKPKAEKQQATFDEAHDLFKDVKIVFGVEE